MKYLVNQRVRELIEALGYKGAHDFGQKLLGKGKRTDKIKNFYHDHNCISTEILTLITTKIVNSKEQKPNGHWLLTGEGPMFLEENITPVREVDELKDKLIRCFEEMEKIRKEKEEVKKNVSYTTNQP